MDQPRPASLPGVARALVSTVGPERAADILIVQLGWDEAAASLAAVDGADGCTALWHAVAALTGDEVSG